MSKPETVKFLVAANAKGPNLRAIDVPIEKLKANLEKATAGLSAVFQDIIEIGRFQLKEVEIGVEIGAEGGVEFIGTATASGKASITLIFKPNLDAGGTSG